ncbi:MAG: hypothetical protein LBG42_02580 [Treponema sp.]|nr:hypothetical protein [Treponema sp.]
MKLASRVKAGSKEIKKYDKPRSPCQRASRKKTGGLQLLFAKQGCSIISVIEQIPYKNGKMRSILRDLQANRRLTDNPNPAEFSKTGCRTSPMKHFGRPDCATLNPTTGERLPHVKIQPWGQSSSRQIQEEQMGFIIPEKKRVRHSSPSRRHTAGKDEKSRILMGIRPSRAAKAGNTPSSRSTIPEKHPFASAGCPDHQGHRR